MKKIFILFFTVVLVVMVLAACRNSTPIPQTEVSVKPVIQNATLIPTETATSTATVAPTSTITATSVPTKVPDLPSGEIIYRTSSNIFGELPGEFGGQYYSLLFTKGKIDSDLEIVSVRIAPDGSESREPLDFQSFSDGKSVTFMTFDKIKSVGVQEGMTMITYDREKGYSIPTSYVSLGESWLQLYTSQYPGPVVLLDNTGYYQESVKIYQVLSPGSLPTLTWDISNPFPTDKKCGNWDIVTPSPDGNNVIWYSVRFTGECEGLSRVDSTGYTTSKYAVISKTDGLLYTFTEFIEKDHGKDVYYPVLVWSSDSTKIMYEEQNWGARTDCYYLLNIPLKSTVPTELFCRNYTSYRAQFATWSPDGTKVAMLLSVEDPHFNLEIVVLDALKPGVAYNVLENQDVPSWVETTIAWSPDSEWLTFALDNMSEGRSGIYAIRSNGTDLTPLLIKPEWNEPSYLKPYPYVWWTK